MQNIVSPEHVAATLGDIRRTPDKIFYILSGDLVMQWEGYKEAVTNGWYIVLMCPKCGATLTLDSKNKKVLVDEKGLHIAEPIRCTAPAQFGGMCSWQVIIEPPKKSSEMTAIVQGIKYKISAVARLH